MPVLIDLSSSLRDRTGHGLVHANGHTLLEIIDDLDRQYPGFKSDIYSSAGNSVRGHVLIAINGKIVNRKDIDVAVSAKDKIRISTASKGG